MSGVLLGILGRMQIGLELPKAQGLGLRALVFGSRTMIMCLCSGPAAGLATLGHGLGLGIGLGLALGLARVDLH